MAKVSSKTIVDAFKHDKCEKCGRAEFADEPGFLGLDSNGVCANCRKPQPSGMQWVSPETKLPEPFRVVWIKRERGVVYIGYRLNKPLSTNPDPSGDCWWYGNNSEDMTCKDRGYRFRNNFSDVTVAGWAYVTPFESSSSSMQAENERLRESYAALSAKYDYLLNENEHLTSILKGLTKPKTTIVVQDTPDPATRLKIVQDQLDLSEEFISDLCKEFGIDELEKWDEWKVKKGIAF